MLNIVKTMPAETKRLKYKKKNVRKVNPPATIIRGFEATSMSL